MNNWRLLLLAFFAVCYPAASYTERNLVDGREQCCDRQPHTIFQETKRSYGTHRFGKPVSNNLLNHRGEALEDRRYGVRTDNSVLNRPSADERLIETRSERDARDISPEHIYSARTEGQRSTPISEGRESHRISPRDISRDERSREIARVRIIRETGARQHDRENMEPSYNRLSHANRRVVRSYNEDRLSRISMDIRRETQRNRGIARELRNIQETREARNILQRTRDDVARSQIHKDLSDRRIAIGKVGEQKPFTTRSEPTLHLDTNRVRRSLKNNDDRRVARKLEDERRILTTRSESRLQLHDSNMERRSLDRNIARMSKERMDERRSFIARSESRHLLENNRVHQSLERSDDRRIAREMLDERRAFTVRSESRLLLEVNRERRSLDRNDALISRERMDERRAFITRSESRNLNNNRDRQNMELSSRRITGEMAVKRSAFTTRSETRRLLEDNRERRSLDRNDALISRERMDKRGAFNTRSESRNLDNNRNRQSMELSGKRITRERADERSAFTTRSESRLLLEDNTERRYLDRNDARMSRERMDDRRAYIAQSESRHLDNNRNRRSMELSDRRIARKRADERTAFTTQIESSLELEDHRERSSLDRNNARMSRERMDERRAYITRSESRHLLDNGIEHRSLERSDDRRIARERLEERRAFTIRSELNNNKERRSMNRHLSESVNEYRRSSLPNSVTVDHNRRNKEESRMSIRSKRHEPQHFNSGQEVKILVERSQQHERTIDISRGIHEERNRDTRTTQLERSVNRRDNRIGEKHYRAESRQDRASIRNREVVMERRARSIDQLEVRDSRRDTKPARSINIARQREVSTTRIEYRIMERDSRFRSDAGLIRRNYKDQTNATNWQYLFYTLQGIYLCGILIQLLSGNESYNKKSRTICWWTFSSQNFVKVD